MPKDQSKRLTLKNLTIELEEQKKILTKKENSMMQNICLDTIRAFNEQSVKVYQIRKMIDNISKGRPPLGLGEDSSIKPLGYNDRLQ